MSRALKFFAGETLSAGRRFAGARSRYYPDTAVRGFSGCNGLQCAGMARRIAGLKINVGFETESFGVRVKVEGLGLKVEGRTEFARPHQGGRV